MNTFTKIFWIIIAIVLIVLFFKWTVKHDAQIAEGAAIYEACVAEQYHTSPAAYYQEHGEYPECE